MAARHGAGTCSHSKRQRSSRRSPRQQATTWRVWRSSATQIQDPDNTRRGTVADADSIPTWPRCRTTSVRLEVEQIQLVGKWSRVFWGVSLVEGPQNGRFLEKSNAENL